MPACIATFWIVRLLGAQALRQVPGRLAERLFARLDAHPTLSVLSLRLVFQTAPALNVALALSGVGFRPYLVGTVARLPLPIAAYTLFFETLAHLFHWTLPQGH